MAQDKIVSLPLLNKEISFIKAVFLNQKLHGEESRARNLLIKTIQPLIEIIDMDREDITRSCSEKDDKGEPKFTPDQKAYVLKDRKKYAEKIRKLEETEIVIDILPSARAGFIFVRDYLKTLNKKVEKATIAMKTITEQDAELYPGIAIGEKVQEIDPETKLPIGSQFTFEDQEFVDTATTISEKIATFLKKDKEVKVEG